MRQGQVCQDVVYLYREDECGGSGHDRKSGSGEECGSLMRGVVLLRSVDKILRGMDQAI